MTMTSLVSLMLAIRDVVFPTVERPVDGEKLVIFGLRRGTVVTKQSQNTAPQQSKNEKCNLNQIERDVNKREQKGRKARAETD